MKGSKVKVPPMMGRGGTNLNPFPLRIHRLFSSQIVAVPNHSLLPQCHLYLLKCTFQGSDNFVHLHEALKGKLQVANFFAPERSPRATPLTPHERTSPNRRCKTTIQYICPVSDIYFLSLSPFHWVNDVIQRTVIRGSFPDRLWKPNDPGLDDSADFSPGRQKRFVPHHLPLDFLLS